MENNHFKLLYQKIYFGRVLFIILDKKSNKILLLYKSSGFSRTGHKDKLLPFFLLNSRITINGEPLGYIYKVMLSNGKFETHYKFLLGKIVEFLKPINEFVKDIKDNRSIDEVEKDLEENLSIDFVKQINSEIREIVQNYELFDYELDLVD